MRLKSLFIATLVSMLAILLVSFLVFSAISSRMQRLTIDPTFERWDEFQLESARAAYESAGKNDLAAFLYREDHTFIGSHYLLDGSGLDLLSGENRAKFLPAPPATRSRNHIGDSWVITHRSRDGKYWFVATGSTNRIQIWTFLPYYFLVIGAIAVLFWLAAVGVILPIRRIAAVIAQFGQGNLSVRIGSGRPDEIGQLGRSFNQMAERLERLILSERRLLSDISHELRSPLARLKFAVKLARSSPDSAAALDRIERDVDRIASLVSDIVEIACVEQAPALRGEEKLRIECIVREILRDCALESDMRRCCLRLSGQIQGETTGSRELLRRAIENVVRNAIRYSPEDSTIEVALTQEDRCAVIVVRDYGPGVPEESLSRIFDPFFRVEEARTPTGGGSGLGLSIAKRAVVAHCGAIAAENARPGLRVRIEIPLATETASPHLREP